MVNTCPHLIAEFFHKAPTNTLGGSRIHYPNGIPDNDVQPNKPNVCSIQTKQFPRVTSQNLHPSSSATKQKPSKNIAAPFPPVVPNFTFPICIYIRLFDTLRMASSSRVFSSYLRTLCSLPFRRSSPGIPLSSSFFIGKSGFGSLRLTSNLRKFECRTRASMAEIITPKSKGKVQVFDAEDELAVSLAKYTADLANKFSKEKDSFTVVLSGGSLIKSLR